MFKPMFKPLSKKAVLSALCLALCLALSFSLPSLGEDGKDDTTAKVSEMISLSSAKQQYDQMVGVVSRSLQGAFLRGLQEALQQNPIGPEQEAKVRQIVERHAQDLTGQYASRLNEIMPWDVLVKEVYVPVYVKHFSPEEIDVLLAFHRSSAGQKFNEKVPVIMQDASQTVNAKYGEALGSLAQALITEQIQQAKAELAPLQSSSNPQ